MGELNNAQLNTLAEYFQVSTDFLMGKTVFPDKKNFDIEELGLSVEATKNLYTGKVDVAREISTLRVPINEDDLIRIENAFAGTIKDIKKRFKEDNESKIKEVERITKENVEKMFAELTKGKDIRKVRITPEQLVDAIVQMASNAGEVSASDMEGLKTALVSFMEGMVPNESLGIELDDLMQEGLISLFECIATYNPDRENMFLTFAATVIHNAVLDYVRKCSTSFENRNLGNIYSMNEALQDEIHSTTRREFIIDSEIKKPDNICIKKLQYADLHRAMHRLSERDKMYVSYRYGFTDDTEHSLAETARHFHLSLSRCGATEELALDNVWLELPWWY